MEMQAQIKEVTLLFPELLFDEQTYVFKGSLEAFENDVYLVLIDIHPWPRRFPYVYETGERIPHDLDRHIYTDTGNCCFTTPRLEEVYLKSKVKTLTQFIERIVVPYLQNNSYYELHGTYSNGEFSHSDSTLETYQTLLKIKDVPIIINVLYQFYLGNKLSDRHTCYCSSNRTFRKCSKGTHKIEYQQLQFISKENLAADLLILYKKFGNSIVY